MRRGQTSLARRWLLVAGEVTEDTRRAVGRLPRGTGVVLLDARPDPRLRLIAARRGIRLADGAATARVHDATEIRRARLRVRRPLVLLSPVYPTRSHPGWAPLPRMKAAALARLAGRPLLALGGMNERRFRRVRALGFDGWAGIDAWGVRT